MNYLVKKIKKTGLPHIATVHFIKKALICLKDCSFKILHLPKEKTSCKIFLLLSLYLL